jgi:hypothetical protein
MDEWLGNDEHVAKLLMIILNNSQSNQRFGEQLNRRTKSVTNDKKACNVLVRRRPSKSRRRRRRRRRVMSCGTLQQQAQTAKACLGVNLTKIKLKQSNKASSTRSARHAKSTNESSIFQTKWK